MCGSSTDMCGSNPCKNGGTCRRELDKYVCLCVPGATGINCETGSSNASAVSSFTDVHIRLETSIYTNKYVAVVTKTTYIESVMHCTRNVK